MTEELSPADRSSLAAERGPVNMAVGGLLVFDPEPPLTRAMVAARLAERIHLIPRLRQRLEQPPLGLLANPLWVDDQGFDLDWHVRQASLPPPGGEAELGALVGREFSHRLDRARPLWEATLIEGLRGGRRALLMKVHHALVDGVAAIGMAALVLDPSEEPLVIPPPEEAWSPRRYDLRQQMTRLAARPLSAAAPLDRDAGRAPVALVPVSVRGETESEDMGNRISTVFVDLPIAEPDLGARVREIADQTRELKDSAAVRAGALMVGASGWAPPLLSGLLARALGTVRAFNLVVSNIPGPQQPFYLSGVRMREVYPIVPLNPANQGLTIGILSYDGIVCFGVLADRDLDPPLATAAEAIVAALEELDAAS